MELSVEISLYPLVAEQYHDDIWAFIDNLNENSALTVITNGLSTQVFGEYDEVMTTVTREMKKVHEQAGVAVFVCKFVPGNRAVPERD